MTLLKRPTTAPLSSHARLAATTALLVLGSTLMTACAPLVLGGAAVGGFMAADRRTSGTQVEDKGIEFKASGNIKRALGEKGHVTVSAYNRVVLLTGEVPSADDKLTAEHVAARTENVRSVVNELGVMGNSSVGSRSNDLLIETKVKATLVDARDVMSSAVKLVVERGEVFLMGIVSEREANRIAELTSTVSGVQRVVKVLHIISEDELAQRVPARPASAASSATGEQR